MKCENCGFENNEKAKFCTRCGASLVQQNEAPTQQKNGNNTKYLIVGLTAIIIVLICAIGYFAINLNEIRLAIEAMSVPKPPKFVPIMSAFTSVVKPDNKSAAGTLLIT